MEWQGLRDGTRRACGVRRLRPDYLLFTDADIHHDPDNVARLVANARQLDTDLLSSMVRLTVSSGAERWLIPAFVFFFFLKLYPPAWIARAGTRHAAGAAGGCMLVRPAALGSSGARPGGDSARRCIDDCSLARSIKRAGGRVCVWDRRARRRACDPTAP